MIKYYQKIFFPASGAGFYVDRSFLPSLRQEGIFLSKSDCFLSQILFEIPSSQKNGQLTGPFFTEVVEKNQISIAFFHHCIFVLMRQKNIP